MSVLVPPPQDELELLIREARARQRRRRLIAAAAVAAAAAAGFALFAVARGVGRPATGPKSPGAAALPKCKDEQLRLSAARMWNGAAGSLLEPLTLTNVSGSDCSLAGWPSVRRLDRAGRVVPARTFLYTYEATGRVAFHTVALKSGGSASFNFFAPDWNHASNRSCVSARRLQVRPPGDRGWLSVAANIPACPVLYVDPLVPGRTDGRWGSVGIQHFARP